MSDHIDKAVERETELRDDALAKIKRLQLEQSARPSLSECESCGSEIPEARRRAVPGVQLCISCQTAFEKKQKGY